MHTTNYKDGRHQVLTMTMGSLCSTVTSASCLVPFFCKRDSCQFQCTSLIHDKVRRGSEAMPMYKLPKPAHHMECLHYCCSENSKMAKSEFIFRRANHLLLDFPKEVHQSPPSSDTLWNLINCTTMILKDSDKGVPVWGMIIETLFKRYGAIKELPRNARWSIAQLKYV